MTCAEVTGSDGYVGDFKLQMTRRPPTDEADLEKLARYKEAGAEKGQFVPFIGILPDDIPEAEETRDIATGSVVLATGFKHYTPRQGEYGYGENPEVITLPDLIKLMAEDENGGPVSLQVNGRPIRTMAMIRCVGSRQIPGVHEEDENGNVSTNTARGSAARPPFRPTANCARSIPRPSSTISTVTSAPMAAATRSITSGRRGTACSSSGSRRKRHRRSPAPRIRRKGAHDDHRQGYTDIRRRARIAGRPGGAGSRHGAVRCRQRWSTR